MDHSEYRVEPIVSIHYVLYYTEKSDVHKIQLNCNALLSVYCTRYYLTFTSTLNSNTKSYN